VSVSAESLTAPGGLLVKADLFPGESDDQFGKRLEAYIGDGDERGNAVADEATRDLGVAEWAYYRAFSDAYLKRRLSPQSVSTGVGSHTFTDEQLRDLLRLAEGHRAAAGGYGLDVAVAFDAVGSGGGERQVSRATHTVFVW
jgi:hypothetical protein